MVWKQFSIRSLLIATMLIALLAGLCLFAVRPLSVVNHGDPAAIVDQLLPPISKGDHYLSPSPSSKKSVWLFGAFNNGRKEENVLIEKNGKDVRYRAYWLNADGKLWCLDLTLTVNDWNALISKLQNERIERLPNLVPDVSHAMTYWLKFDNGNSKHEACVYAIEWLDSLFPGEKRYANNWKAIIDCLLLIREQHPAKIRSAKFLPNGSIDWESAQQTTAPTTEIFDW